MMGDSLIEPLTRLAAQFGIITPLAIGVFARISAVVFLLPGLGERTIPMRVRLGAAIAITLVVAPVAPISSLPAVDGPAYLFSIIGAETIIGLIIGFALRLSVFVLLTVGAIAAQHLSMSMLFGAGLSHEQESPLGSILMAAGLAIAASHGVLVKITSTLIHSYEAFPFAAAPPAEGVGDWAANAVGSAFAVSFTLSAPFVILGFIYAMMLAAMSRAMPQLMAAFVGAPAVIFAGMVLFAGTVAVILSEWSTILEMLIEDPVGRFR